MIKMVHPLFLIILLTLFSVTEINAPPVIYGVQLVGYAVILVISYFYFPYISRKNTLIVLSMLIALSALSLWQYSYLEFKGIFLLNTIRTMYWMGIFLLLYPFLCKQPLNVLEKSIRIVIFIAALSLIVQFLSFYIFHYEIELSILLGGEGVRSYYSGYSIISYRPTGLTAEPAIHSGIMLGLMTLYYLLNKQNKLPIFVGLISIFLSFSTLGALLALAFIFIIYNKGAKGFLVALLFLGIALFFIQDSLISRYEQFISGGDASNNVKLEVVEYLFSNFNYYTFGLGFSGKDADAPYFFEALYDLTYFFTPVVYFGIYIGSLVIIISIALLLKSQFIFSEKMLILLSFIKLSSPSFMFFNFFVLILFVINNRRVLLK